MSSGNVIAGRKLNSEFDLYETPTWAAEVAIDQMLKDNVISKDHSVLEPCCGPGAICKVLENRGISYKASDIQREDYIFGHKGVDVYNLPDNACDIIITNPPYNRMTKDDMLLEFLRIARKKVILLLNIYFLSSDARKEMLEQSHLKHLYIHSKRVTMYPYGEDKPKNGGTKMFAWFVWDKGYSDKPTLSWI